MKWFFALNDSSPAFDYYAGMVQVAVLTARKHTQLEPVFVHDGRENRLTDWLADRGVQLVRRRSFLAPEIDRLLGAHGNAAAKSIALGAYLRVEVPAIVRELGWADRHVLYTDCDVMFTPRFDGALAGWTPPWFAVAPENDPQDWAAMNTGVMVMNVDALLADLPAFQAAIRAQLAVSVQSSFDQHAYREHYRGRWEHLPAELNWKPYWGRNDAAQIVHFHGPKPFQKYAIAAGTVPPDIARLATAAFYDQAAEYDRLLVEAVQDRAGDAEPADAFAGIEVLEGLLPTEGPYPAQSLPRVRWGLAPKIRVRLRRRPGTAGNTLRLVALSQLPGQEMAVRLNGREIRRHVFRSAGNFEPLRLNVAEAQDGEVVELVPETWRDDPDGQNRAVLFRALWLD